MYKQQLERHLSFRKYANTVMAACYNNDIFFFIPNLINIFKALAPRENGSLEATQTVEAKGLFQTHFFFFFFYFFLFIFL